MKLGNFEIFLVSDGYQRLDGGAMFGVVPKVLWEKKFPPDEKNRITLSHNCLLVKTPYKKNILVDTGTGGKETEKFCSIYGIERDGGLAAGLSKLGVSPSDIHIVINSHLHFDHAGGNTIRLPNGNIVPTFPNATYYIQRGEWECANSANERTRASYFPHNFKPLADAGLLKLIDGETKMAEGITAVPLPGHTRHLQGVKVESEGKIAFYLADMVPTSAHIPIPWVMAYDLYPEETMKTKKEIFEKAIAENWLLLFEHDPKTPFGRLRGSAEKPEVVPEPFAPGDYITPFNDWR